MKFSWHFTEPNFGTEVLHEIALTTPSDFTVGCEHLNKKISPNAHNWRRVIGSDGREGT